jgi:hypothetical protein
MLGESSNAEKRARRAPRGSVSVLITTVRRRGAVPGLERRLRAGRDVPTSGQIVFRGGAYQVLR